MSYDQDHYSAVGKDQTVPYGTDSRLNLFQAINCLATIILSLRDKSPDAERAVGQPPRRLILNLPSPPTKDYTSRSSKGVPRDRDKNNRAHHNWHRQYPVQWSHRHLWLGHSARRHQVRSHMDSGFRSHRALQVV